MIPILTYIIKYRLSQKLFILNFRLCKNYIRFIKFIGFLFV